MNCQVSITLPISLLGVAETRMANDLAIDHLFLSEWKRPQRFSENLEALHADCRFPGARAEQGPRNSDYVAKVEVLEDAEAPVSKLILAEVELDAPARICEMREHGLAMSPPCNDAAGDRHVRPIRIRRLRAIPGSGFRDQGLRFRGCVQLWI